MRFWTDCAYYNDDNGKRCNHPKYRKLFDGSFQCNGHCFRKHRSKNIEILNDDLIENGGDHVL